MDLATTSLLKSLILPPGGLILLGMLGLLLSRVKLGRRLLTLSLLLLWLISLPIVAKLLMAGLERYPAMTSEQVRTAEADAIVVLGASRYLQAPEYGEDTVGRNALFRLRYAAWLARQTGLPIIPSGGIPLIEGKAEAQIHAEVLRNEFGVKVEHIEQRSRTTWENARYTAQLMHKLGLRHIILVTDAGHMPRAVYAFERNGISLTPAPTGFVNVAGTKQTWFELLPSAHALLKSYYATHEYLGLLWYYFK